MMFVQSMKLRANLQLGQLLRQLLYPRLMCKVGIGEVLLVPAHAATHTFSIQLTAYCDSKAAASWHGCLYGCHGVSWYGKSHSLYCWTPSKQDEAWYSRA